MANVTTTTAGVFIPEIWRDSALDYAARMFRLVFQITDLSSELSGGGNIVNTPRADEETARQKSAGTNVTFNANTDGETILTVNQHWYSAKSIEDVVKVQESANLFGVYTQTMGYSIAKKVENYLAEIIQSSTAHDTALTTDSTMTAALLRTGLAKMLAIGVDYTHPAVDTFIYGSPQTYLSILGLDQFVSWEKIGPAETSGNKSGIVGEVYGNPTSQSADWKDVGTTGEETASFFTKESVQYAQQMLRVQSDYSIDQLATKVVADVFFGATLTQSAADSASQIVNWTQP